MKKLIEQVNSHISPFSKKLLTLGFVFIFLFVIAHNVFAATNVDSLVGQAETIQSGLDKTNDLVNNPDKDKIASDYLKQEWGKILVTKPIIGDIIRAYKKISPYTDPVFEWAVGMVPALSWLFVLTFLIWFTLMRYSYLIYDYFQEFEIFSKINGMIIHICLMVIVLITQILQSLSLWISNLIINSISVAFGTWWGQIILVVGTILILALFNMIQKTFRVYLRKMRMDKYQNKIKKVATEEEKSLKEKTKPKSY